MSVDELIEKLGGTGATARRFGLSDGAISLWRQRGIPKSRYFQIWQACQAAGIDWTPPESEDAA